MLKRKTGSMQGFTLVELSVVGLISAIVVLLAFPSFTEFLVKSKRKDNQQTLSRFILDMQRHRSLYGEYPEQIHQDENLRDECAFANAKGGSDGTRCKDVIYWTDERTHLKILTINGLQKNDNAADQSPNRFFRVRFETRDNTDKECRIWQVSVNYGITESKVFDAKGADNSPECLR